MTFPWGRGACICGGRQHLRELLLSPGVPERPIAHSRQEPLHKPDPPLCVCVCVCVCVWVRVKSFTVRELLPCMKKQESSTAIGTGLCRSAVAPPNPLDSGQGIHQSFHASTHPPIPPVIICYVQALCLTPERKKRNNNSLDSEILGLSYGETGNINHVLSPQQLVNINGDPLIQLTYSAHCIPCTEGLQCPSSISSSSQGVLDI